MTARAGQVISNAELLQRVKRIEAELRRITAILAGGAQAATDAGAWVGYMERRAVETGQLRRELGIDPPLYRPLRPA